MRVLPLLHSVFAVALFSLLACGGTVADPAGGTPSSDGGNGGDSGSSATDASSTIDTSSKSCEELLKDIDALRPKVRTCCVACRAQQCQQRVEDLCCPISATTVDPEFVTRVAEYKRRCGASGCPGVVCKESPSNFCEPDPNNAVMGTCR
ncbi:MAG TPA: hypothetical protein VM925_35390 [Labilithrix sp.]|jgi:hypothetical protein|nr:hypothetical protein [Labilithrix sp.]